MSNARLLAELSSAEGGYRNKLYNGCFDIWQRGATFNGLYTSLSNYYGADRWQMFRAGGAAGATFSRIAYNGPNAVNACRAQRDSGNTSTASINVAQSLETFDIHLLRGKTVTLSFRYLTGANFSGANLVVYANYGTGTDGNLAAGFTSGSAITGGTLNLAASTAQRYVTMTFTIPSSGTQFGVGFVYNPTGTAGANDYFEITNVQLELGAFATPYAFRPLATELQMCQRYYERTYYRVDTPMNSVAYVGSMVVSHKATKRMATPRVGRIYESMTNCTFNSITTSDTASTLLYNVTATPGNATGYLEVDAEV